MGLHVIARTFDRSEVVVMSTCLESAGVPHWTFGYDLIRIDPLMAIGYDGFRIVVCAQDRAAALAVLREAREKPLLEGERLSTHTFMILSILVFFATTLI
jgi:hypothetical protein